jgi:hypothetical protein
MAEDDERCILRTVPFMAIMTTSEKRMSCFFGEVAGLIEYRLHQFGEF